jgi:hypothetical protein
MKCLATKAKINKNWPSFDFGCETQNKSKVKQSSLGFNIYQLAINNLVLKLEGCPLMPKFCYPYLT